MKDISGCSKKYLVDWFWTDLERPMYGEVKIYLVVGKSHHSFWKPSPRTCYEKKDLRGKLHKVFGAKRATITSKLFIFCHLESMQVVNNKFGMDPKNLQSCYFHFSQFNLTLGNQLGQIVWDQLNWEISLVLYQVIKCRKLEVGQNPLAIHTHLEILNFCKECLKAS